MKPKGIEIEEILIDADFKTSEEALLAMANSLVERGVCKPSFAEAILKRERDFPTGLETESGIGVALPHTDAEHVNLDRMMIAVLKNEVEFAAMGFAQKKVGVRIIVMIAISTADSHLPVLQRLSDLLMDAPRLIRLSKAKSEEIVKRDFEELLYKD